MKTAFVFGIGILLGAAGVWLAPRNPAAPTLVAAKTTLEPPPSVVAAAQGRVEGRTGNIEVGASASGVIESLLVEEGQKVSRGQVLGRIACENLDAEVRALQASVESAKQARARILRGSRDEERQVAQQAVAAAQANVEQARRQNERMQYLASRDDVSQQSADGAKRDLAAAEAALASALAKQKLTNDGPLPEEAAKADADVAAAEERLRAVEADREKCVIRAPIAGTITRLNMRAGETYSATAARPIMTLADLSKTLIRAEVDERDLSRIKPNQRVRITAEGFPAFTGKVLRTEAAMGRKTAKSTDPAEKSDRDILETLIEPDPGTPHLPVGLRVVVQFLD